MRKQLLWLVWHIPLGSLAPWVFGAAIGRAPHKEEPNVLNP